MGLIKNLHNITPFPGRLFHALPHRIRLRTKTGMIHLVRSHAAVRVMRICVGDYILIRAFGALGKVRDF